MIVNLIQSTESFNEWADPLGRRVVIYKQKDAKVQCLAHRDLMGGQIDKIREANAIGRTSVDVWPYTNRVE